MNFLNPVLLAALPLVGLPILIHLINRQRHRTVQWGAMMFLLDAKRMTRGMARLRFWLIMAMRMLAIATLIFAVARPLASGWIGLTLGGQADTTIILLDRSPSMEQQDLQDGQSKRATAVNKLAQLLETWGGSTQIVLVDSVSNRAQQVASAAALQSLPSTSATAASADVPAMLQTALDYMIANQTGRTDIWICSDLRRNDWNVDDGRWPALRESFERLDGTRFYLLSYAQQPRDNVAVRVTSAHRRQLGPDAELVLDIAVQRESPLQQPLKVPLELTINGARTVVNLELDQEEFVLQGHTIPLDDAATRGWGQVELPADSNPADNRYYFTFAEPPEHRTAIVSDDPAVADPLRLAAVSPVDPTIPHTAQVISPQDAYQLDWDATSLILWHASLPTDTILSQQLESFVTSGRPVIFFPPAQADGQSLFGVRWDDWQQGAADKAVPISSWRSDSDLLRQTQSGSALPVGKLRIYRYCGLSGNGTALAQLDGGHPLLLRATADGPVYFCATLPEPASSSLVQDGVVLYVMVQRALAQGTDRQGLARLYTAGSPPARSLSAAAPLSALPPEMLLSERTFHAGVLQAGEMLAALNRSELEDGAPVVDRVGIDRLLSGLDYRRVEDSLGGDKQLASEIWRAFLMAMAAALLVEAVLCMPERRGSSQLQTAHPTALPTSSNGSSPPSRKREVPAGQR